MKRLLSIIAALILLYSIYYDIRIGTLPDAAETAGTTEESASAKEKENKEASLAYFEKKVAPGETVLSVIEAQLGEAIPVPIADIVSDFETLNNGTAPTEIQSGKTYKFPDYSKKNEKSENQ